MIRTKEDDGNDVAGGTELAYMDESYDDSVMCMSALIIPAHRWRDAFDQVKDWRRDLRDQHGIYTNVEFHATDFCAGRGNLGEKTVPKALRAKIFREAMDMMVGLPGSAVISAAISRKGKSRDVAYRRAFKRVQERLNKRAEENDGYVITISDEGRSNELRKVARKIKVHNPVGSRFGRWSDGSRSKNIPTKRLVEDPVFRSSDESYFLQLADFVAYALLKSEVDNPSQRTRKYSLDKAYDRLEPICVKKAHYADPRNLGIVRK